MWLIQELSSQEALFWRICSILAEILDFEVLWNKMFNGKPVLKTYGKQRTSELKVRKKVFPHLHPIPIMAGWVDGGISDFTKEIKDSPYSAKSKGWRKWDAIMPKNQISRNRQFQTIRTVLCSYSHKVTVRLCVEHEKHIFSSRLHPIPSLDGGGCDGKAILIYKGPLTR